MDETAQVLETPMVPEVEAVPLDDLLIQARKDAVAEVDMYESYGAFDGHMRSGFFCALFDGRLSSVVTYPSTSQGRKAGVRQIGQFERFVELIDKRGNITVNDQPTPRGGQRVETTVLVCLVEGSEYIVTRTRAGVVETLGYDNNKTENFLVMSDTISVTPREEEEVGDEG